MSHNRAFWKAFHSLTHPLSLIAILLLLFNDHWLRYAHPSWLTGKLGDFTWLVFAPFITALLFAWLIPQRLKHHTKIVGWLSIGFIGVWFATAKTIPFVHELTTETLYWLVGWRGQLRLDVTDLLTLPALIISWYVWQQAGDSKVSLKPLAYVAFGLGILGTLASDDGPRSTDSGVYKICERNGISYTQTNDYWGDITYYHSSNGGLFWTGSIPLDKSDILPMNCIPQTEENQLNISESFILRWTPNESIEISSDKGNTWTIENNLEEINQEVREHYTLYGYEDYEYLINIRPSPAGAYYDTQSGNVIFAMSHNGVLVRESDGNYTWVTVGDYGLENLLNVEKASNAIFFELWLMLATMFLVVTTATLYIRRKHSNIKKGFMVLSWLGYAGILLILLVERNENIYLTYYSLTALASLIMFVFFGIPLSIGAMWDILRNFRKVALNIFFAGIGTGALFIFPFLLWTQGRIPRYLFAYVLALLLTVLGLYATSIYLERILPTLAPEKLKNEGVEKDKIKEEK